MSLLDARDDTPLVVPAAPIAPAPRRAAPRSPRPGDGRPRVDGRALAVGSRRLLVRGVTYGTFAPDADGTRFPDRAQVAADFAAMSVHGINAVRVYTPPPRWLLDIAADAGLWVLVGMPWEQHVAFLTGVRRARRILRGARRAAAELAGHPALLGFAVGNEIPASIVRWHGRRRVERFLDRLCGAVRAADPEALVTYVSFPSTEYLRVPAADLVTTNVYLEDPDTLARYVARLQNLAGERPLLLGELGRDSRRAGEDVQAQAVAEQVRVAFDGGCAGAFVFSWTDEWHRGEDEVLDWDFGLTRRDRSPKPALAAVATAFAAAPPRPPADAPLISVVVCTYNGAATLRECLQGVLALDYPRYEVIVVDDGSTDASASIARSFGVRVVSTGNFGLSAARNTGMMAARGEIVAYLDDDAWPDRDWLTWLARTFRATGHAAVGGPNIPPHDETGVAACVANAPGGPVHVLLSDTEAEHLPGCNMAFRRDALLAVGGFDHQFRTAGDDVDICWRLMREGMTLGFHPAAMVWHRRRATVRRFWRQQRGYGRAEALLERKWPEKYNAPGHPTWGGRLYGRGTGALLGRSRIYHGTWGTAPFQGEVPRPASVLLQLASTPEWYLLVAVLSALTLLGVAWRPLLVSVVPLTLAVVASASNGVRGALAASFRAEGRRPLRRLVLRGWTLALHLIQPAARLAGRLGHGLVPWRRPRGWGFALPLPRRRQQWTETWAAPEARLHGAEASLRAAGARVRPGDPWDRWDLHVAGGALGGARLRLVVEEHGRGRQLARWRVLPRVPPVLPLAVVALLAAGARATAEHAWVAAAPLVTLGVVLATVAFTDCGIAVAGALRAMRAAADRLPTSTDQEHHA